MRHHLLGAATTATWIALIALFWFGFGWLLARRKRVTLHASNIQKLNNAPSLPSAAEQAALLRWSPRQNRRAA